MAGNVLVVTELKNGKFRKTSFEVISEGRRIADELNSKVAALVIGAGIDDLTGVAGQYGADIVLAADDQKLRDYTPDFYLEVVLKAVQSHDAEIVLMSATTLGRDLAPRVAARLDAGLASDCLQLFIKDGRFEAERPLFAGKAIARVAVNSEIKMATLRPNIFPISKPDDSKSAPVESLSVPQVSAKMELKGFRATGSGKMDLTEADVIVTGGRGMRNPENFNILEELAELLSGVVGATRAVVDSEWRPHSEQVGQTGKTVSPNLYMMFGASGSIQHWAGMSGAKCIVAVNKDANAPIIERADYSIVGDLFEVVPVLTEEIRKLRG